MRERWIQDIYRDYPKLRAVPMAVESMVDYYIANDKAFKKEMRKLEEDEKKHGAHKSKPPSEHVFYGLTKIAADEVAPHTVSNDPIAKPEHGCSVEVQDNDP
jgi:hypothetical protein